MKKNKIGFTLGEILVSLTVIGVIMALSVHTIKMVKTSYASLTYHAFNNVNMIVGEIISGQRRALDKNKNSLPLPLSTCRLGQGGMLTTILAPDHRSYANPLCFDAGDASKNGTTLSADNLFCNHAVFFANTAGKTRCETDDLFDVAFDETRFEPKITGINDKWDKPNFVATNGHRYYISKWSSNANVSDIYGFRIIAVDLNGKSAPNKTEGTLVPDIVQFLVLDNGEVYPIGVAGSNVNVGKNEKKIVTYLNTRIKGYNYRDDDSRTTNIPSSCIAKNPDGSTEKICNFAVMYLQVSSNSFLSYKEALCGALEGTGQITYENYCLHNVNNNGAAILRSDVCPPSSNEKRVDECAVKIVKPAFRYNFR